MAADVKWWQKPQWAGVLFACQACETRFAVPPDSGKCPKCAGDMTAHFPPKPTPSGVQMNVCGNVTAVKGQDVSFCGSESAATGDGRCPTCARPRERTMTVNRALTEAEQSVIGDRNAKRKVEFDRIAKFEEV
jgi:hypothetical protein